MDRNCTECNYQELILQQWIADNLKWKFKQNKVVFVTKHKIKSKRKSLSPELRQRVYARSGMMCEICHEPGKAVHHLKSVFEYPELQRDFDNLIHLCLECHAGKHTNMRRSFIINNPYITYKI